ncbi:MAG TPA: hypothetical protein VFG23_08930 [Polyangia bacterium]|nr:hypothetical protein [Polyangia bacterium]
MNATAHGIARDLAENLNQHLPPAMKPATADGANVKCGSGEPRGKNALIVLTGGPSLSRDSLGRPHKEFVLDAYQLVTEIGALGPNETLPLLWVLMTRNHLIQWWQSPAGTAPSVESITGSAHGTIDLRR